MMNPKHILILAFFSILASCGSSSNFQKRKFLNLKPLETPSNEDVLIKDQVATEDVIKQEEIAEEMNYGSFEEGSVSQEIETIEAVDYYDGSNDLIIDDNTIREKGYPENRVDKKRKLFKPFDATHMEEQKKGIIFLSVGAGFYLIGMAALILFFQGSIAPLVAIILVGVSLIALIVFGILAIRNGKRALKGKKEKAVHWIARIAALAGGIFFLVVSVSYLWGLVFLLLFL